MRSRTSAISRSSGTRRPCSMIGAAFRPSSVPLAIASLSMSPVEILGTPRWAASLAACVPFPAPGGPRKMTRAAGAAAVRGLAGTTDPLASPPREAVVMPHDQLRLDPGHGVHGHAHDDEQRGAAKVEVQVQALGDPPQVVLGQEHVERRPG